MAALTELRRRFAEEYFQAEVPSLAGAYRLAGGKAKDADKAGSEIMKYPEVQEYVASLRAARSKRTQIDADYVLNRLKEMDELDVTDIINDDLSGFKPLSEWPKAWRRSINAIDISEIAKASGSDASDFPVVIKKIKWPDKVKNLELIGKHVSVQAFNEKTTVEVVDRASILAKARKRASDANNG